ncbi:hypothetical protein HD554DRAFT_2046869 [Boletus coccyginus]|nr:hypothetical protein HD554DRAFT_2046869 [Boletus coccyginus]
MPTVLVMSDQVELWVCLGDGSKLALSIPLAQCTTFATTPLKWLRFLGFAIYGRQGHISMSMNGPELDYTLEIQARSYYFVSNGEPRFVDVDAIDKRSIYTSESDFSTGRANFTQALIERDGTCALTGQRASDCDACHFIPHSKGDDYMLNLFRHRHEMYGTVDPLDSINDIRNGILLFVGFHRALDARRLAFLKTPNFALTVGGIPYHKPPDAGSPENRLTLQHFETDPGVVSQLGPHNSDARQPQDVNQWPLAIIVDLSYTAAALQSWGPKTFIEYVRENSRDAYYPDDEEGDDDGGPSGGPTAQVPDPPTSRTIRYDKRSAKKAQAVNPADQPTSGDMDLYDGILALWKQAAREARDEKKMPGSDAAGVADNRNKIQTWLHSMEESTS